MYQITEERAQNITKLRGQETWTLKVPPCYLIGSWPNVSGHVSVTCLVT